MRTTVAVVGGSQGLAALCESLARADELVLRRDDGGLGDSPSDVVLLEVGKGDDPERLLTAVRDLTAAPVVLLAASPSLVEWALEAGVADVLVQPYDAGGVQFALEKAVRAARSVRAEGAQARVVTVFSPKGGTGKSVVAANLATALARRGGKRTLLVDLDLQFGDAAIMLGLRPRKTLRDLVASPAGLDADTLAVYVERHSSGLDVLAAPLRPEDAELVDDAVVRNVLAVARATYDVVVVDTSPFFHGSTLAALDLTDELLLLCNPDIPTVKNVRLALETLELLALPSACVRIVLNRNGDASGLRVDDVANALGRRVDFILPLDAAVSAGVNRGAPAVLQGTRGDFGDALMAVARGLFPEDWPPAAPRRFAKRRLLAFAGS